MKTSGVLFDLYGTLFTYGNMAKAFKLWHEDLARALKSRSVKVSVSEVAKHCKHFFAKPVTEDERYTHYELRLQNLAREFGDEPDYNWIKHTAATSMNRWQSQVPIHPQTIPLLESLRAKGIKVGVISNFEHAPHVRRVLRKNGLLKLLDAVVISGEVHVKKPDPEIFQIALKRLDTQPEETLFVGDDPERDIRGAAAVGLQTKLYKNGASLFDLFSREKSNANAKPL